MEPGGFATLQYLSHRNIQNSKVFFVLTGCLKCEPRPEEKLGRLQMECFVVVEIQTEMFSWSGKTNRLSIAQTYFCVLHKALQTCVPLTKSSMSFLIWKRIQLLNNIRRCYFLRDYLISSLYIQYFKKLLAFVSFFATTNRTFLWGMFH